MIYERMRLMHDTSTFQHPLQTRYTSDEMKRHWSDDLKFRTWRKVWIVIAQIQRELGLTIITEGQIAEMVKNRDSLDYDLLEKIEAKLKHDVLTHIQAFGIQCPNAKPIIHLGCTSCDITDNAELVIMREAIGMICVGLAKVIDRLRKFAYQYRDLPTLGYTHFQAAQLVTVGKRASLWLQDLMHDLGDLERLRNGLEFRGLKGVTGTQASFLALFNGDHERVKELDRRFGAAFQFTRIFPITGQTYSRRQDTTILSALASFGASAYKMCDDLRRLAHLKEIEEPMDEEQKGSSAMPYKRNPMRCERACGLARYLMNLVSGFFDTHATQWLERSLDDSSFRRMAIAEAFLTADAILRILQNVSEGLIVYPKMITAHLYAELPFMATENIIAAMVKAGGDRQEAHHRISVHSRAAAHRVKNEGLNNNLVILIRDDPFFAPIHAELDNLLDPSTFIGRAPEQVEEFMEEIDHVLKPYKDQLGGTVELKV